MTNEIIAVGSGDFERHGFPKVSAGELKKSGFDTKGRVVEILNQQLFIINPSGLLVPALFNENIWKEIDLSTYDGLLLVGCRQLLLAPLVIDKMTDHLTQRRPWRNQLRTADNESCVMVESNALRKNVLNNVLGPATLVQLPIKLDTTARQLMYDIRAGHSVFKRKPGYDDFSINNKLKIVGRTRQLAYEVLCHYGYH